MKKKSTNLLAKTKTQITIYYESNPWPFASVMLLSCLIGLAGCSARPPATPPTFVMAWTSPRGVNTLESNDGMNWINTVAPHAGASSAYAPAVGHDGGLSWMLMWTTPRGIDYKTGVGGVPPSGNGGVIWEGSITTGKVPVRIGGSPTVAYGDGRWVVVYRNLGGALQVVRTRQNSATDWEAASDLLLPLNRPVVTSRDPVLSYGNNKFVLAYILPGLPWRAFAATSIDGLTWTVPRQIPWIPPQGHHGSVGITYHEGFFFAVLSTQRTPSVSIFTVFISPDGVTWAPIPLSHGGNASMQVSQTYGVAYGQCRMIIAKPQNTTSTLEFWTGMPDDCNNPGSINLSPTGLSGTALPGNPNNVRGAAVAFGQ